MIIAVLLVLASLLVPSLAQAEPGGCLIAIDVGHTRDNPGEISARGRPEQAFNATLAERFHAALQARGVSSLVINLRGDAMDLHDRPALAAKAGAALLISIHHDSVQDQYKSQWRWKGERRAYSDRFSGYGLFVSGLNPAFGASLHVAEKIADGLRGAGLSPSLHHAEPIEGENRPLLDAVRGIYRYDGLVVLKSATIPAILVEAGVIVNRAEELKLRRPEYQDKIVAALVTAAAGFCQR